MKKALILHAWYSKPENNWYPWLKEKLDKKKYEVLLPEIPAMQESIPDMGTQLSYLENLHFLDEKTTVIGHSLGCLLALRLAEKYPYEKMILVAGWDYDDLYPNHKLFWKNKINHEKIIRNVKKIYCISSDNDPYVTEFQAQEMNKRLKGTCLVIKKGGHFGSKEKCKAIPQLIPLF